MPLDFPEHREDGYLTLAPPYLGKPRIATVLLAILTEVQEIECAVQDMNAIRQIDGADDTRLTVLGRLVGQANLGWPTETYRSILRARIGANRSNGKPKDILRVAHLLLDAAGQIADLRLEFPGQATLGLRQNNQFLGQRAAVDEILPDTRGGGVQFFFYFSETTSNRFRFRAAASSPAGTHGFGGVTNPGNGGVFTNVRLV